MAQSVNLQTGVDAIRTLLGERKKSQTFSVHTLGYALSVLSIERQLNSRPEMLETVATG